MDSPFGDRLGSPAAGPAGTATDERNCRTIEAYEQCAVDYAQSTASGADLGGNMLLRRLLKVAPAGCTILEIGSGPGWEADWLEDQGCKVRRTDAATAFVDFQKQRGKEAELLDVVTDDLGGPYSAIAALYVFQHIDRGRLPSVFRKISDALADGGALLFSLREGEGEFVELGSTGGQYYTALWTEQALEQLLAQFGLKRIWSVTSEDADGRWLSLLFWRSDGR
jgi:protein-L-isoaspartate O-methyltransferase